MKAMRSHAWSWFALALLAAPAAAQTPRIGIIDFYGLRTLAPADLAGALGLQIGDSLAVHPDTLRARLRAVPGVVDAAVSLVCCEAGRTIVYVGIREAGALTLEFNAPPAGAARLPEDITRAGREFLNAMAEGVRIGQNSVDESAGHAIYLYPPAHEKQVRLIQYAVQNEAMLREVLLESSDPEHRALAAQVIAYVPNKANVVSDLVTAARDHDALVRNNAIRATAVMSMYAQSHPDAGLNVPYAPFIDLLNSLDWTDRNKASFALAALTTSRDSALLQELQSKAFASLAEMARWRAFGHAAAAGIILGRIAGLPEEQIYPYLQKNRDALISAASPK